MTRRATGNEAGSVLLWIMVAGLFAVGSLGAATRLIPTGALFTMQESDTTTAFIAAESGVNYVAYRLKTEGLAALDDLDNPEYVALLEQLFGDWALLGSDRFPATFAVEYDAENDYIIVTGMVAGQSRSLRAKVARPRELPQPEQPSDDSLDETPPVQLPAYREVKLDAAVFAVAGDGANHPAVHLVGGAQAYGAAGTNSRRAEAIKLEGGANIHGNVLVRADSQAEAEAGVSVPDWITLGGSILPLAEEREYPLPEFPAPFTGLPARGSVQTRWDNPVITISEHGHYDSIYAGSGQYKVVFETGGRDLFIRARSFRVEGNGSVEVTGGGRLHLYVDETLNLADKYFNINGDPLQAVIYYAGQSQLTLASGFNFRGAIFVKNANVRVAGSFGPQALIFSAGKQITINGGANLTQDSIVYAPAAHIVVGGGARVGMVVGNSVRAEGGAAITRPTNSFDALPLSFGPRPGAQQPQEPVDKDVVETLEWHFCFNCRSRVAED